MNSSLAPPAPSGAPSEFRPNAPSAGEGTAHERGRASWVDVAKGLGISLVVLVHVRRGLRDGGLEGGARVLEALDTAVGTFAMPLFFLLSGLFLERSLRKSARAVLFDKLRTLAYPYLLWTLLYTLINAPFSGLTHLQGSILQVVSGLLYKPYYHLWFLYVLALGSGFYFALQRARLGSPAVLGVALAWYETSGWWSLAFWDALATLRWYFVYLALGAAAHSVLIPKLAQLRRLAAAAVGSVCLVLFAWLLSLGSQRSTNMYLLQALLAAGAVLLISSGLRDSRLLRYLGQYSLEIYLAHALGTGAVRLLLQFSLGIADVWAHCAAGLIAGLALPLGLAWCARRLGFEYLFRWPGSRGPALAAPPGRTSARTPAG